MAVVGQQVAGHGTSQCQKLHVIFSTKEIKRRGHKNGIKSEIESRKVVNIRKKIGFGVVGCWCQVTKVANLDSYWCVHVCLSVRVFSVPPRKFGGV